MLPFRRVLCLTFASLTVLTAATAWAQAPEVDRSEVEAKKKAQEEKEKAKAAAVVQESDAAREQREAQEHKEQNAKEAVKRFAEASEAARKGQTARALTLLEAAAALDPYRHEFPMNVAAVAEALKQPETEFRAYAAAAVLLRRVIAQVGDSPKKPEYEAQLKKAETHMADLKADGKAASGTIRLFAEPKSCEIFLDGAYVGQGEGVMEWLRVGNASEEVLALEVLRILVDGDMAAVIGTTTVRARRTAITYTTDFVHLVTVGDGRVTRFQEFFDTHLAAAAFAAP